MIPEFWNATVVAKSKYFDGKEFIYLCVDCTSSGSEMRMIDIKIIFFNNLVLHNTISVSPL